MKKGLMSLALLLLPLFAQADLLLVTSAQSPVTELTREQAQQLFLGRGLSREGVTLMAVDLPSGDAARDAFYQKLTGRNAQQMNAYWARMIFTGRGNPPAEAGSTQELQRRLRNQPDLVGYMRADQAPAGLRVLLTLY